jgi:hypothetical protein
LTATSSAVTNAAPITYVSSNTSVVNVSGSTLTFAAGLYISGLPVSLKNNVAFSAADGNSGASYGHALGSAATNRIFPQSASNVDKLVISGTYCTYP